MIRFGFWTDTHARFETPEERTDNFFQSLLLKLEEVGQIFKDEKVDYTLFGGDLYDSDTVAKSVITGLQTLLRSWQLPIIGIVGSHDYTGYQMKSLKSTALGITESAGIIDIIGGYGHESNIIIPDNKGTTVNVVGNPHTYTFTDSKDNMYVEKYSNCTYQIQLVHADLNVKPAPWRHILVQDGLTDSDLVLSGHYHPGWEHPVIYAGKDDKHNVIFINPGSIARMKNTGMHRIPRVCIIEVEGNQCNYKFIPLKSAIAHPFAEKKVKVEEDPMMDIQLFLDLIGGAEVSAIDIKLQLPLVAKEYGFTEEVVEEAFKYIDGQTQEEK